MSMDFETADRLKLFSGNGWLDVQAKLLSNKLIIVPIHNTSEFKKFWIKPSQEKLGNP